MGGRAATRRVLLLSAQSEGRECVRTRACERPKTKRINGLTVLRRHGYSRPANPIGKSGHGLTVLPRRGARHMHRVTLPRRLSASLFLVAVLAAGTLGSFGNASAQATGTVTGRVVAGKEPQGFANVIILGTRRGAASDESGNFTITLVPVGTYQLKVQPLGFEPKTLSISVNAGSNNVGVINVGAEQKVVKQMEELEVKATKLIDTKSSSTVQKIGGQTLKDLPIENLKEAVALKAGVVNSGGELHLPGGRGDETKFQGDGITAANPRSAGGATIAHIPGASA